METEVETKQTLPDHVLEYIATLCAFDALCNALIEEVEEATKGKKDKCLAGSLSNYLGDIWHRSLLANDLEEIARADQDRVDLVAIASEFTSDETINGFIEIGISNCQDVIELSFIDICEDVYSRFSQIVELLEQDTYSSTLSLDLEEYDVTVTVLASGLLMRCYLEAMKEKFYGESEYPEDFLDVQKETWKGLRWLEDTEYEFNSEAIRRLAIMCRHIQPLSIVRGMQYVYHSLPNLLKAHIGGVDIYIDDLVAEKIEDLEYLECLITLEKEEAKDWFHSQQKTLISNRLAELLGKRLIINTPDMSEAILDAGQIPYCLSIEETLKYLQSRQDETLYLRMFQVLELFLEQVLFFSMKYPADMLTEHILAGGDDKEEDWKVIRDLQDEEKEALHVGDLFESIILGTYQPSQKEVDDIVDYTENDTDSNSDAECNDYDDLMDNFDHEEEEKVVDLLDSDTVESTRDYFMDLYEEYQESRNMNYKSSNFDTFIMDGAYIKQFEYVGGSDVTSYFKVEIDGDYYNTYYNYGRVYVRDQNDPVNFDADWKTEEENGEPIRARIKESEKIYLYRVSYDFIYSIMKDMIEYALSSFEDIYIDGDLIRKARELIRKEWRRVGNKGWRAKSPVEINLKVYKKMFENIGTILMNLVGNLKPKYLEDLKDSLEEKTIDEQILAGVMGLAKLMYPMFILMVQSDVNSVLDEGYDMYIEIPEDTSTEDLLYTLYLALYAFGSYRTPLTEERWFSNLKSKIDAYHPLKKIEAYIQNAMEGTLESWSTLRELYTYIKYEWEEPSTYCINLKYQLLNDTDDLTDDEYDSYNAIFHAYEGSQAGLERMVRCFMAIYPVVLEIEAYQM
ncbi:MULTISPECIES: hypothetical protein [unclassified Veillonella]|uniref:hypothetical protein n=1 Tax=unclassified Veillonella TaxID=2630086 RepID=UPI000F8DE47C|nr:MULTISPECIES: hypothetical protein [unclassified Veillonella]